MSCMLPAELIEKLRAELSEKATLLLQGDPDFREATQRWTEYQSPRFAAVVIVGEEGDIQTTMRHAKAHHVPFMASTAKHGDFAGMQELQGGIQISLRNFDQVEIVDEGKHALIGGGVTTKKVTGSLWAAGKVTVTGVCESVGVGLWLGGGHGLLQGKYGVASDQIVEARVILADGQIVTVSESSETELFWGLKGAGYNFGIVSQLKIKVFDAKPDEVWTFENHIFSSSQIESVFPVLNDLRPRQGPTDHYFAMMRRIPEIDPENAVILVVCLSSGDTANTNLHEFLQPLYNIPSIAVTKHQVLYPDAPAMFAADENGQACRKGSTFRRYAIDLTEHNVTAIRKAYDLFNQTIREHPELGVEGSIILESYPVRAVQAIAAESSAFPWRADHLLVAAFLTYEPNPDLDEAAIGLGRALQKILHEGSAREEMHVYINYANGEEKLESLYGYEPWRLQKLRQLKAKFDPEGLFRYHGGIDWHPKDLPNGVSPVLSRPA